MHSPAGLDPYTCFLNDLFLFFFQKYPSLNMHPPERLDLYTGLSSSLEFFFFFHFFHVNQEPPPALDKSRSTLLLQKLSPLLMGSDVCLNSQCRFLLVYELLPVRPHPPIGLNEDGRTLNPPSVRSQCHLGPESSGLDTPKEQRNKKIVRMIPEKRRSTFTYLRNHL